MLIGLDHIQLAMPEGAEEEAVAFYSGILGLIQIAKPAALAGRGGVWFEGPQISVHLGVETPFAPARKAHPAFRVASLDEMVAHLNATETAYTPDADLPGIRRVFVADPFGNRIELLERV